MTTGFKRPHSHCAAVSVSVSPAPALNQRVQFLSESKHPHPATSHNQITKMRYSALDDDSAIEFLRRQSVTEPFFYVEVKIPTGLFGKDNGDRIYDRLGQFIEAEPKPEKITYDDETSKVLASLAQLPHFSE